MGQRRVFSYFCMLLVTSVFCSLYAGVTGKIAGRIIDKTSGKPLAGVNVIVIGTGLGAATGEEGEYVILRVPPGVYEVKASYIGYVDVTARNVRVRIDETTTLNFEMEQTEVKGEVVTVVAKRKLVKDDVSASLYNLSEEEAASLPVNTVEDIVGLQAGITGWFSIRGSSPEEVLFQIDGITMRDPRNNNPITEIAVSAVKEIRVERGGFNAEYGQVRSGIVNVVTKEGSSERYHGRINIEIAPPQPKHFGISPYDENSYWLRPYLDDEVCWTGTESGAWDKYTQRQYPKFDGWNKVSKKLYEDDDPSNDLSPAAAQKLFRWYHRKRGVYDKPDYDIDLGFGGPVPLVSSKLGGLRFYASYKSEREYYLYPLTRPDYFGYAWTLQLNSDISDKVKLQLFMSGGKSYNVADNGWAGEGITNYLRSPLQLSAPSPGSLFGTGYYSLATLSHRTFSLKLTHVLSSRTYYEFKIESLSRKYLTGPAEVRDTTKKYEIVEGLRVDEAPYGWWWQSEVSIGDGMFMGGHTSMTRDSSSLRSVTLKFDLTSQVNFSNMIKAGIEFSFYRLNFDFGLINKEFPEGNTWTKTFQKPYRLAMYVQDKVEAEGFIMNVGLRLDYSNPNTEWVDVDFYDRSFFSSNYDPERDYKKKRVAPDFQLSPRFGISHPITENSKLFFNYGHFKQLLTYEEMFRLSRGSSGEMIIFGDPGLASAKTVAYEVGYDHALFGNVLLFQVSAFYKDISNQHAYTTYYSADKSVIYNRATNDGYADIRGFEVTLRKQTGRWWSGFANYTYTVTSSGYFGKRNIYQDPSEQRKYDMVTKEHYQFKPVPQPYARFSINFFTPPGFGPKLFSISPLDNMVLNFTGEWYSGWWGTYNPKGLPGVANNVHYRDWYNVIMRLMKGVSFKKAKVDFYVEVFNLFNWRFLNLYSFSDYHDEIFYFASLHLPESEVYDNIPGNDRPGDYRKPGVPYQPIEIVGEIDENLVPEDGVIYWERNSGKYMEFVGGEWREVEKERMDKILKDKAYIDMPNLTSFNFLNPRRITVGIKINF